MLATRAKNKLSEIEKPRGFERNLPLDQIVGAATDAKHGYQLYFLVQWQGCDELDLLPASEVNERCPLEVIGYYEERSQVVAKCERRKRVLEQAERDLVAHPPAEAPEAQTEIEVLEDVEELAAAEVEDASERPADAAVDAEAAAPVVAVEDAERAEDLVDTAGTADNSMAASAVSESSEGGGGTEPINESVDSSQQMETEQSGELVETGASATTTTGDGEETERGVETPTMDEEDQQNDSFLADVASEVAQHQARTEAMPEDIEMPNVGY